MGVSALAAFPIIIFTGWMLGAPKEDASVAVAAATDGPKTVEINTTRRGIHHVIRAAMVGPNGRTHMMSFVVDTGATDIVLPASMIERLGFNESDLDTVGVQTANGAAEALRGYLRSLQLGGDDNNDTLQRVPVMFMDDYELGGEALMGMSVFGRYNMTIEDDQDRIILVKKR